MRTREEKSGMTNKVPYWTRAFRTRQETEAIIHLVSTKGQSGSKKRTNVFLGESLGSENKGKSRT